MDPLAFTVLHILAEHCGPEQRISRRDMLARVNFIMRTDLRDDKPIRDAIKDLRANDPQGCYIVSSLDGGTFLARTREEAEDYMRPDWSRVNRIRERLQAQEKLLAMNEAPQWVQETKQMEMRI